MAVAEDPHAADRQVPLAGVVVEQRDGHVRAVGVEQHRPDRALAAVAGTEDDGLLAVEREGAAALLEELAGDVARAAHPDERDDPGADDRAQRRRPLTGDEQVDDAEHEGGDDHGPREARRPPRRSR